MILDAVQKKISSTALNEILHDILVELFEVHRDLFPDAINSLEELHLRYNAFHSFRRGSDTRAHDQGITEQDIVVVNCWFKHEQAGSKKPALSMSQMYADLEMLIKPFLRYTGAM